MKTLMLSTAILAAMAAGATAQTQPADAANPDLFYTEQGPASIHASDFIGMRVYAAQTDFNADTASGIGEDWEDIGEINDVILDREGKVDAVLVDIGGFLGMGERQVALAMSSVKFVNDDSTGDQPDDFFLVVNAPRESLEAAPEYGMADQMPAATDTAADTAVKTDTATDHPRPTRRLTPRSRPILRPTPRLTPPSRYAATAADATAADTARRRHRGQDRHRRPMRPTRRRRPKRRRPTAWRPPKPLRSRAAPTAGWRATRSPVKATAPRRPAT